MRNGNHSMRHAARADGPDTQSAVPRCLLFVVNEAGEFVELRRIADAASAHGWSVAFLFAQYHYRNLAKDVGICRSHGYEAFAMPLDVPPSDDTDATAKIEKELGNGYVPYSLIAGARPGRGGRGWRTALSVTVLGLLFVGRRLRILSNPQFVPRKVPPRFLYLRSLQFARKVYRRVRPALVVYGQDFPGAPNAIITRCCEKDGIPTVIAPFALGTTKEMVESLHDKPAHQADNGLANKLAAELFPQWTNYYKGRKLLRLPGEEIFIQEGLHLAPPHPWIPNSGHVTRIAVESEQMHRYYRSMHFPEQQLALTGSAYDDLLARTAQTAAERRRALAQQLRIDADRKWLVCAWPTDQFGTRHPPVEFADYGQLCHAWAAALEHVQRTTGFQVVICPHPVTPLGPLRDILDSYGLARNLCRVGTLQLVSCSDLFVACVSSTLRWAISLGIPAINYDCYEYGYTDFDAAAGTRTVTKLDDFEAQLREWTTSESAYLSARRAQQDCAPQWGMHDGQSTTRILALFESLTTKP